MSREIGGIVEKPVRGDETIYIVFMELCFITRLQPSEEKRYKKTPRNSNLKFN